MRRGQVRLYLRPVHDGAFTSLSLRGALITAVPPKDLATICQKLSFWSGWPVECVLPAGSAAPWFEYWTEVIDLVPARLLEVRFVVPRVGRRRRT